MSCSINPQNNRDLNQGILHLWSKVGGPSLNGWWVIARTSSKWGKFWLKLNLTLKVKVNHPKNNRDLNQGLLHPWFKFGDPSWNGWWVMSRTISWLTHRRTHTHTHRQTQATTIPEGQNWPRVIKPQNHGKNNVHRLKTIKHQRDKSGNTCNKTRKKQCKTSKLDS